MSSVKTSKEIYVVLANGKEVGWEYEATLVVDPDYGADADGRRGTLVTFIDDITPVGNPEKELRHDLDGNPLTDEEVVEAVSLLDRSAREDSDYEFDEYDGSDDEYDRLCDEALWANEN